MNRMIGRWAALIHLATVILFALCMLLGFDTGSYTVCMVMALAYVTMTAAFCQGAAPERRAAGFAALGFAGVYAAIILLVYFAQVTTVTMQPLTEQASVLLDYSRSGLYFYYDLLGYGVMALSTFFAGLTVRRAPWLRRLLMLHGLFFLPCMLLPMLGVFPVTDGSVSVGGIIALECWCAFFVPVDVLAAGYLEREDAT